MTLIIAWFFCIVLQDSCPYCTCCMAVACQSCASSLRLPLSRMHVQSPWALFVNLIITAYATAFVIGKFCAYACVVCVYLRQSKIKESEKTLKKPSAVTAVTPAVSTRKYQSWLCLPSCQEHTGPISVSLCQQATQPSAFRRAQCVLRQLLGSPCLRQTLRKIHTCPSKLQRWELEQQRGCSESL